jgi:hypothetical protein
VIDAFVGRLHRAEFGVPFLTAVTSLVMSTHWPPMALPTLVLMGLFIVRPAWAVHPAAWWLLALLWLGALVVVPERMEDHVPLFTVWLVALAICLHRPAEEFMAAAALQARLLVGVTFATAVAWKLYFGTYLDGVTLWTFMIADHRFGPLSMSVGLSGDAIGATRTEISRLLTGEQAAVRLHDSGWTALAIVAVSLATLALETVIAVSHLAPDGPWTARLRLFSLALFGVVTYGVVPVLPFAVLLAVFAMTTARWRREAMWVLPVFMIVIAVRVATLTV